MADPVRPDDGDPGGDARSVPELLDRSARRFAGAPFLVDGTRTVSFAEVRSQARSVAAAFLAAGVQPGDRIAVWAPNSIEWVVACLGLQYAGAVLVPINTRYRGGEAGEILARSGAVVLLTVTDFMATDYVELLRADGPPLPRLREIVVLSGPIGPGTTGWSQFRAGGDQVAPDAVDARAAAVGPEDLCEVLFTSGTTGSPKGVMLGHGQSLRIIAAWNDWLGFGPADRYIVLNPFFHVFGTKYGWMCALMAGAAVYPLARYDPDLMIELIERERITVVPGQPTVFRGLMSTEGLAARDLSSLRLGIIGSTSIPAQVVRDMRSSLGFPHVVTGYGLTETCGEVTLCRLDDDVEVVANSVGRPLDDVEVRIAGPTGEPGHDGEGEILVRGYNVMRGYLDDPEATGAVLGRDGWLHTGDIGRLDSGLLRITGRLKDIFIVGGFNVAPAEVEAVLGAHPAVADVAVIGVPDERLGEVGAAFVVRRTGAAVGAEELIRFGRDRMANFKLPRTVEFVDALPYNSIGKVERNRLREDVARRGPR